MEIKECQSYHHEEGPAGVQFARRMKAGIEIGKTEYSHCTPGEKDQSAYQKKNNDDIHLDTPLEFYSPNRPFRFWKYLEAANTAMKFNMA